MGFRSWFRRWRLNEEDWQAEIRAHLALDEQERIARGTDPGEARYAARREFGNVTLTTEAARRVWMPAWMDVVRDHANDVRYAIRTLTKNPGFSLAVIGVLTLGIGLNAAVFTMLKGLALSPVAGVEGSAKLVVLYGETGAGRAVRLSYPEYRHLRDHDRAFNGLFGNIGGRANIGRGRDAQQVWIEIVTGNYFQSLGVRAQHGRTLLPSDELSPSGHPIVVISDSLWRRHFAADPAIVGRTIDVNNQKLTIVGVTGPEFHGTTVVYDVDLYVSVMMGPALGFSFGSREKTPAAILNDPRGGFYFPTGFLRPGVTLDAARAQMEAAWDALRNGRPADAVAQELRIGRFWKTPGGAPANLLPTLTIVIAMGLLVLTIACANIAGLVLVRGVSRRGEIAVRLALGASRARIVRLLMIENLVLALPAALLGVDIARRSVPLTVGWVESLAAPERIFLNIEVDRIVLAFAVLVACGSALVFAFMPALRSARIDLVSVINEDASPRGAGRSRMRASLVVAQVAVSLLLLVGAGLVTRSLEAARTAYPGYDATGVTAVDIDVQQNGYDEARGREFYRKLLDEAAADAGVETATLAFETPLTFLERRAQPVTIEGYEARRGEDLAFQSNTVGPRYFQTLRIPMAAGRDFDDRDDPRGMPSLIVNRTLAVRYWRDPQQAIGKRVRIADGDWRTIVGVAEDVKYVRINEAPRPFIYMPFFQAYRAGMILHTRGTAPMDRLVEQARARVAALDPDLPAVHGRSLAQATRGAMLLFELAGTLLMVFGAAGMTLAALGTYGLVSYTVRQSTREIGIRMALGATGRLILRTFLTRGLRLGAIGAAIGVAAALGLSGLIGSLLYGVSATDAGSFLTAAALVLGAVLAATAVPSWRASRTNPLAALRHS